VGQLGALPRGPAARAAQPPLLPWRSLAGSCRGPARLCPCAPGPPGSAPWHSQPPARTSRRSCRTHVVQTQGETAFSLSPALSQDFPPLDVAQEEVMLSTWSSRGTHQRRRGEPPFPSPFPPPFFSDSPSRVACPSPGVASIPPCSRGRHACAARRGQRPAARSIADNPRPGLGRVVVAQPRPRRGALPRPGSVQHTTSLRPRRGAAPGVARSRPLLGIECPWRLSSPTARSRQPTWLARGGLRGVWSARPQHARMQRLANVLSSGSRLPCGILRNVRDWSIPGSPASACAGHDQLVRAAIPCAVACSFVHVTIHMFWFLLCVVSRGDPPHHLKLLTLIGLCQEATH
jgi:hypothetical protein